MCRNDIHDTICICSEPLSTNACDWTLIPRNTIVIVKSIHNSREIIDDAKERANATYRPVGELDVEYSFLTDEGYPDKTFDTLYQSYKKDLFKDSPTPKKENEDAISINKVKSNDALRTLQHARLRFSDPRFHSPSHEKIKPCGMCASADAALGSF